MLPQSRDETRAPPGKNPAARWDFRLTQNRENLHAQACMRARVTGFRFFVNSHKVKLG